MNELNIAIETLRNPNTVADAYRGLLMVLGAGIMLGGLLNAITRR